MKGKCSFEVVKRVSKSGNEYSVIRVTFEGASYVFESFLSNEQTYILEGIIEHQKEVGE